MDNSQELINTLFKMDREIAVLEWAIKMGTTENIIDKIDRSHALLKIHMQELTYIKRQIKQCQKTQSQAPKNL